MEKKNVDLAIQLRHELHAHPELSYQEDWTKQRLIDFLKEHTKLEIVDKGKWFYAIYRAGEGKKNLAFRADFDALPIPETIDLEWGSKFPGVSHKCGHDGHASSLAGFALEIDRLGADKNIFFVFQHAEETAQGGIEAAAMIKEEQIDEIFAYHNMSGMDYNAVYVIDGTAHFASKGMSVEMIGSPAHASQPEDGKNPSLAIADIVRELPEFTSKETNEGLVLATVVQIDVGEEAFGSAANKGVVRMTIRAEKEAELDKLQKNIEDLAIKLADEQGLKANFTYNDEFPDVVNTKESVDKIRETAKEKGIAVVEMQSPFRGSEDFGHYIKYTKGAMCYIGNGQDYPHVHTFEYDFRDELIETAVELFKGLAEKQ
ncbi:M20 metallopeptidase family protein [Bacillus sp. 1P06AnD]|uniref:M20 metallopeptidase family protein n=1 Tax=Bacillus sp. 1P06AnD TaxID=3132208 RepID=UPI00399FD34E